MRLLALAVLSLLILAAPVSASATEATKLQGAIAEVNGAGMELNSGLITMPTAAARLAGTRDTTIGDPATYTDACRPLAFYLWTMADYLARALTLFSTDPVAAKGYVLVGAAQVVYLTSATALAAMAACQGGPA